MEDPLAARFQRSGVFSLRYVAGRDDERLSFRGDERLQAGGGQAGLNRCGGCPDRAMHVVRRARLEPV